MPPDAYHHEDALSEPFSIKQGDCFTSGYDIYRVRMVEGGFVLVENLNTHTQYGDYQRMWMSLGTLAAMQHEIV